MRPRVMFLALLLLALTSCSLLWKAIEDPVIVEDTEKLGADIIKAEF